MGPLLNAMKCSGSFPRVSAMDRIAAQANALRGWLAAQGLDRVRTELPAQHHLPGHTCAGPAAFQHGTNTSRRPGPALSAACA